MGSRIHINNTIYSYSFRPSFIFPSQILYAIRLPKINNILINVGMFKSTDPDTKSIGPNTAIGSPKLILLQNLFGWFIVG